MKITVSHGSLLRMCETGKAAGKSLRFPEGDEKYYEPKPLELAQEGVGARGGNRIIMRDVNLLGISGA